MSNATVFAELIEDFMVWLLDNRRAAFDALLQTSKHDVAWLPSHLPVLATFNDDGGGINLATKGFGPIPRSDRLEPFTQELTRAAALAFADRISTARSLYLRALDFDRDVLGSLEIFGGTTRRNLVRDPRASLLFVSGLPSYRSYQLTGRVEIVHQDDDRYRYLVSARGLFPEDGFHLRQPGYECGYLFHVEEFADKTPFRRGEAVPHDTSGR